MPNGVGRLAGYLVIIDVKAFFNEPVSMMNCPSLSTETIELPFPDSA